MTIVAHSHPYVMGVDTHARNHVLAVLAAPTGELLDTAEFPTSTSGMARAVAWAARRTGGDLAALWVMECIATFGAQFARAVAEAGYQVIEAPRTGVHRGKGKSDPIDARRMAEAALPLEEHELRHPRADDGERLGHDRVEARGVDVARDRDLHSQPRQHTPPSGQARTPTPGGTR
ncbi:transposase [Streptomyces sp. NPDC005548]|uniref:IS110 family transposase n=1 Tax=Streptomyces sp. NPDC005548 TaxID=3364724 RepID=UPI0036B95DEA